MVNDMITVFNRLTSKTLADYTLHEHIVELHYEKFKYLYYMINDMDLSHIETITCEDDSNNLIVKIESTKAKYLNDVIYYINERKSSYNKSNLFTINIEEYSNIITLTIGIINDEKEDTLYGNRLI